MDNWKAVKLIVGIYREQKIICSLIRDQKFSRSLSILILIILDAKTLYYPLQVLSSSWLEESCPGKVLNKHLRLLLPWLQNS